MFSFLRFKHFLGPTLRPTGAAKALTSWPQDSETCGDHFKRANPSLPNPCEGLALPLRHKPSALDPDAWILGCSTKKRCPELNPIPTLKQHFVARGTVIPIKQSFLLICGVLVFSCDDSRRSPRSQIEASPLHSQACNATCGEFLQGEVLF